jgi:ferredoxin
MMNYSREMEKDSDRRRLYLEIIGDFDNTTKETYDRKKLGWLRMPVLGDVFRWWIGAKLEREHCGQVIPLEEAYTILDMVNPIVRVPCVCKQMAGIKEKVCLGIGMIAREYVDTFKFSRGEWEQLTPDEAKEHVHNWDEDGLVHTVWTIKSPYIFALCQCEYPWCLGWRVRADYRVKKNLRKGEYVAQVDVNKCIGCGECVKRCQFKARYISTKTGRAIVDVTRCYGCGLCKTSCERHATSLIPRLQIPLVRADW